VNDGGKMHSQSDSRERRAFLQADEIEPHHRMLVEIGLKAKK